MGEFATTVNELVDGHYEHTEEMWWLKDKMADLEDRSHRNNLKLRGVPKTVSAPKLIIYIQEFLKALLPEENPISFIIEKRMDTVIWFVI